MRDAQKVEPPPTPFCMVKIAFLSHENYTIESVMV